MLEFLTSLATSSEKGIMVPSDLCAYTSWPQSVRTSCSRVAPDPLFAGGHTFIFWPLVTICVPPYISLHTTNRSLVFGWIWSEIRSSNFVAITSFLSDYFFGDQCFQVALHGKKKHFGLQILLCQKYSSCATPRQHGKRVPERLGAQASGSNGGNYF